MNNTNPIQEQNSTPQSITKNSVSDDESPSRQEKTPLEKHLDEQTIDLNKLFPDADTDLNNLFPDDEVKHLLKNIIKNILIFALLASSITSLSLIEPPGCIIVFTPDLIRVLIPSP